MEEIKGLLPKILAGLQTPEKKSRTQLVAEWPAVAGLRIAAHTKPQLSNKGELVVWVDQPALAYELSQKYKQTLLKRAQEALGKEKVKSVRFFVGQLR